jgi:hypothetical protein
MMLEAKHGALLDEARRRGHANVAQLRLCFQLLSLSSAIDRDCASRLAPHGLSEGRFIVLFLLHGAGARCRRMNWPSAQASPAPPSAACSMACSAKGCCNGAAMRKMAVACRSC